MEINGVKLSKEDMPSYVDGNNQEHLFQSMQDVLARRLQSMQPMNTNVQAAAPGNKSDMGNAWSNQ